VSRRPESPARAVEDVPELRIGSRLKAERQRLGMSLRAFAERTGFSASFISQVELDQASPSLASLAKLAHALGIGLPALLSDGAPAAEAPPVVRARERQALRSQWSRASVSSLLPAGAEDRLVVVLVELEPGGRSGNPGSAIVGREFAFCVKGAVTLKVGDTEHRLGPGDSVSYDATPGPRWSNPGRNRCEVLIVSLRTP
jgi:XRE family transcriptional regulator, regulator of sulfur utilization